MKLPSLQTLWLGAAKVFMRFPLQLLLALSCTVAYCWIAELSYYGNSVLMNNLIKFIMVSNLALTLLLATDLFAETHRYSPAKKWIARIMVLAICTGLFFALDPWTFETDIFRIGLLAFAFHLLVAFAPFIGKGSLNGFWQYNERLFLRILISGFYAGVLFAGLAIALFAIDGLFNVSIKSSAYMKLFAVTGIGFTTVFFLAGVPADFDDLEKEQVYPKGLKIFTQYVLIPLMTIYLAILLVYEIKIAFLWELPKGLVSGLILGYSVFGILSLLLVYPIKDKEGNGWIRLFSRFFYLMIIPLIVLLILAIVKRVGNYGITESRYVLIVLAIWLSAITLYFLFSKKQNIKVIPISLCVLALLAAYGPQSAFSVSKYSQLARLKRLMKSTNAQERSERPAVIRYLVKNHGLTSLQSFTNANLASIEQKIDEKLLKGNAYKYEIRNQKVDTIFALLKVSEAEDNGKRQFNFENNTDEVLPIAGYDAYFPSVFYSEEKEFGFAGSVFKLKYTYKNTASDPKDEDKLRVIVDKEAPLVFDLGALAKKLYRKYDDKAFGSLINDAVPVQEMQLTQETKGFIVTLVLNNVNGSYDKTNGNFSWMEFQGGVLVKKH